MNNHRLVTALTLLNLGIVMFHLIETRSVAASVPTTAQVLRGKALELVDDQGRVRVEMKVFPAQPNLKMPDGTIGYPEAVQLRLITSNGGPHVKLVTTEDGSGLYLGGESGYVQILARGGGPFVKVANTDARQQLIKQQIIRP
jgi:hypothetical protein